MKRKIFSVLFALVLAVSLTLVPAVVSANPGAGDVTIVVQDQAGTPIAGAQVGLFWGDPAWEWMTPLLFTASDGKATFTAYEITTWLAAHGNPTKFQVKASYSDDTYYGSTYTFGKADELPCITYVATTTYTFTYKLVKFAKRLPSLSWDQQYCTVTYVLAEALTVPVTEKKMGFYHGPLAASSTSPYFWAFPKAGGGWDFYDMIDTNLDGVVNASDFVPAEVSGTSLSAEVLSRAFAGITDSIIAVPYLVNTPVTHDGLTEPEKSAAEDIYGLVSSLTLGYMTLNREAVQMMVSIPAPKIAISVSPLSIDFGRLSPGSSSTAQLITVTNTGDITEKITASVTNESRAGFYEANLTLDGVSRAAWSIPSLDAGQSKSPPVSAVLNVPAGTTPGTLTATLVFWAEVAP